MTTVNNLSFIKKDRLRYSKNKLSASLTYLAIVFNALYFVSIYSSDVGSYYYNWIIGISVLYNLIFMLGAFLASEGVKNYKLGYAYLLIILGLGQLVRILIIPLTAKGTTDPRITEEALEKLIASGKDVPTVMDTFQFYFCVGCLVVSSALMIAAGVIAVIKTTTLNKFQAELDKNLRGSK